MEEGWVDWDWEGKGWEAQAVEDWEGMGLLQACNQKEKRAMNEYKDRNAGVRLDYKSMQEYHFPQEAKLCRLALY